MTKAPDAFRTISEVAAELDLPQHVLRFWESRFPQIKPMKRGGGRRYYRPDDVELLRGIRHLLYGQGYTIRGVQRILREQGPRFVQSVWQEGAPQPELAAEPDIGEEIESAEGDDRDAGRLDPAPFLRAEPEAVPSVEVSSPLPPEVTRREPTFAPIVTSAPSDETEAVEEPIQLQVEPTEEEAAAAAEAEAGNGHSPPAMSTPEPVPILPDIDRERLTAVLQELAECRQLLDKALAGVEPEAYEQL